MPFVQHHPKVAGAPRTLSFNTSQGHFDSLDSGEWWGGAGHLVPLSGHVSFYKSDFLAARTRVSTARLTREQDLPAKEHSSTDSELSVCDLLRMAVHGLRAPEPGLRLRYHEITCSPGLPPRQLTR